MTAPATYEHPSGRAYLLNVHLDGCTLPTCRGCVTPERPTQRPSSTTDARKRLNEKRTQQNGDHQ